MTIKTHKWSIISITRQNKLWNNSSKLIKFLWKKNQKLGKFNILDPNPFKSLSKFWHLRFQNKKW
jgi:hypothetical protein